MKSQWNKVSIICEDFNDLKIIANGELHKSKLRPQYRLKEQNSLRRALNCFENIFLIATLKPAQRIELFENDYHLLNIYNVQDPMNSLTNVTSNETLVPEGFKKTKDETFETVKMKIISFELGIFSKK